MAPARIAASGSAPAAAEVPAPLGTLPLPALPTEPLSEPDGPAGSPFAGGSPGLAPGTARAAVALERLDWLPLPLADSGSDVWLAPLGESGLRPEPSATSLEAFLAFLDGCWPMSDDGAGDVERESRRREKRFRGASLTVRTSLGASDDGL